MPSDDPASTPSPVATATRVPAAITVGVCVMRKKCEKLRPLLAEMTSGGDMTVVVFEQQSILEDAVSDWPVVDVLVAFYSKGFPLAKVGEYVRLREPFCFNAIGPMSELLDRRAIYSRLQQIGVAVPKHVVYDHLGGGEGLVLREDYLEVSGVRINKPFVEKPASAEDHNIHIYYPPSVGGGSKRLFRKVGDCSSAFYPDVSEIRRDGAYIYEEFLPTEGADLKVYTVGPKYAYAEARKSPTLDGRVVRDASGKEVRFPVLLTAHEKDVARRISLAFGQMVNGFDILRAHGASYVCDVNGWSFVKSSSAYYQDAAAVLRRMARRAISGEDSPFLGAHMGPPHMGSPPSLGGSGDRLPANLFSRTEPAEQGCARAAAATRPPELRALVAVVRHGDRTPKQKLKMRVRNAKLLRCFEAHGVGRGCAEAKLKTPVQLQEVLDLVEVLLAESDAKLAPGSENSSESEADGVPLGKLRQLQLVLRRGPFGGLNRKLQVKTVRAAEGGRLEEALLVAKWGGELTEAGRAQAERLGRSLREQLSRADGADNLLHLHSTFRHDVKFYSSDEGRVQLTAAAIAKGLLELAGELPPILVSLIRKDAAANALLDDSSAVSAQASEIKRVLHGLMQQPPGLESEAGLAGQTSSEPRPSPPRALSELTRRRSSPSGSCRRGCPRCSRRCARWAARARASRRCTSRRAGCSPCCVSCARSSATRARAALAARGRACPEPSRNLPIGDEYELYGGESLFLALQRWRKLTTELHRPRKDSGFDISKVPDIYDAVKFDLRHNHARLHGALPCLCELLRLVRPLAQLVVPLEYGSAVGDMLAVAVGTTAALCRKLVLDLRSDLMRLEHGGDANHPETVHQLDPKHLAAISPRHDDHLKTRFYLTSESHVYTLLNLLRHAPQALGVPSLFDEAGRAALDEIGELSYLTHLMLAVYEHCDEPADDPLRFQVVVKFSAGDRSAREEEADAEGGRRGGRQTRADAERGGAESAELPLQPLHTLHRSLPLRSVLRFFEHVSDSLENAATPEQRRAAHSLSSSLSTGPARAAAVSRCAPPFGRAGSGDSALSLFANATVTAPPARPELLSSPAGAAAGNGET